MFWKLFYWVVSFSAFTGLTALLCFKWMPSAHDVAWIALFGLGIAAHSMARQKQ